MGNTGSDVFAAIIVISTITMILIEDVPKNWWKAFAAKAVLFTALSVGFLLQSHFAWYSFLVAVGLLWQLYKEAMDHVKGKPVDEED